MVCLRSIVVFVVVGGGGGGCGVERNGTEPRIFQLSSSESCETCSAEKKHLGLIVVAEKSQFLNDEKKYCAHLCRFLFTICLLPVGLFE